MSLLGMTTQRDGTVTFNKNTFKNTITANSNVVNSFFTDVLSTDNSSVTVTELSNDTVPGTYALAKSGSDYTLCRCHFIPKWKCLFIWIRRHKWYEIKYFRY